MKEKFYNNKTEDNRKEIWALTQASNNFYNPNHLLNSDFYFNQRGQQYYTSLANKHVYTFDRWCLAKTAGTSVCENRDGKPLYKDFSTNNYQFVFGQIIDYNDRYSGRTMTFSVKYKKLQGGTLRLCIQNNENFFHSKVYMSESGLAQLTVTLAENTSTLSVWVEKFEGTNGWCVQPIEAKLEDGIYATPNSKLRAAEELMYLKRYYVNSDDIWGTFHRSDPSYIELVVPFAMRTVPTIDSIQFTLFSYNDDGNVYWDTNFQIDHVEAFANFIKITLYRANHGIKDGFYIIKWLLVDAELY